MERGSTIFALTILKDICAADSIRDITIFLYDIDSNRLQDTVNIAQRLLARIDKRRNITAHATQNRDTALKDASFVLVMFQIGGYIPATVTDFEIPKKYGLRQTIGDTLGIGGIMRGLRTIPALLPLCAAMQKLCPQALLINYANPMAMNCAAIAAQGAVSYIGLCHSIPITTEQLADDLRIPHNEIDYVVAGINHLAFYLKLSHRGTDLYPRLHAFMDSAEFPPQRTWTKRPMVDHVRYELMRRTEYFVTESSEHLSEYAPWFIKRTYPELIERFQIPLDEYPQRCREQIADWQEIRQQIATDSAALQITQSNDYGIRIIDSMLNNNERTVYCNIQNNGYITNLPADAIVEIPCVVNGDGIHPQQIGALPRHLAAIMQTNINVQLLTVQAALEKKREHIYHAALLDPHTAAELSIDDIYALVDELLHAHREFIQF